MEWREMGKGVGEKGEWGLGGLGWRLWWLRGMKGGGKGERGKGEEGDAVKLNYIARVEWVNRGSNRYFGIGARM